MNEMIESFERSLLREQRILSECKAGRYRALAQDGSDATSGFIEEVQGNICGLEESIRLLSQTAT
jgi:hypothetical protein